MSESEQRSGDVFDLDQLRRLVDLMEDKDLSEIDLRQLDQRIRLTRGAIEASAPVRPVSAPPAQVAAPAPASAEGDSGDPPNIVVIKSPMVGTFYNRPNPEAPPFVNVGDRVNNDTTVCIIEAMKVFNEIPAEVSGEVVAVLVDNEAVVEHNTPLFKVDTGS